MHQKSKKSLKRGPQTWEPVEQEAVLKLFADGSIDPLKIHKKHISWITEKNDIFRKYNKDVKEKWEIFQRRISKIAKEIIKQGAAKGVRRKDLQGLLYIFFIPTLFLLIASCILFF